MRSSGSSPLRRAANMPARSSVGLRSMSASGGPVDMGAVGGFVSFVGMRHPFREEPRLCGPPPLRESHFVSPAITPGIFVLLDDQLGEFAFGGNLGRITCMAIPQHREHLLRQCYRAGSAPVFVVPPLGELLPSVGSAHGCVVNASCFSN